MARPIDIGDIGPIRPPKTGVTTNVAYTPAAATYGPPVPWVYGTARLGLQPVWTGGNSTATTILADVSAAFPAGTCSMDFTIVGDNRTANTQQTVLAICQAPITGVNYWWRDDDTRPITDFARLCAVNVINIPQPPTGQMKMVGVSLQPNEFTLVTGTMTSSWAALGIGYNSGTTFAATAHVRANSLAMPDGKIPKIYAEVKGWCVTSSAGGRDCNPADVIQDLVSRIPAFSGVSVITDVGPDGNTASSYRTYCAAMGFLVSRAVTDITEGNQLIDDLLLATNSSCAWSEGKLKVFPLGDTATGSYAPPSYAILLDANEFARDDNPVTLDRTAESQVYNCIPVKLTVRRSSAVSGSTYEEFTTEYIDQAHASRYGVRRSSEQELAWMMSDAAAYKLAKILTMRSIYTRNTVKLKLGPRWEVLEPGDLIAVTEPNLGLNQTQFRVTNLEEDASGVITVEALEWPAGTARVTDLTPIATDGLSGSLITLYPGNKVTILSGSVDNLSGSLALVSGTAASASYTASIAFYSASAAFTTSTVAFNSATQAQTTASLAFTSASSAFTTASLAFSSASWLDANKAATDLSNAIAGSVTNFLIASGSVNQGSLAANSVLAKNMVVANFDNLIPNPNSEQTAPAGGWPAGAFEAVGLSTDSPYAGSKCRQYVGFGALTLTPDIPCTPGEQYYLEGMCKVSADTSAFGVTWYKATGDYITDSFVSVTETSYTKKQVTVTAPVSAAFFHVFLSNPWSSNTFWGDNFYLRRMADANLIVDGTITTTKLSASSITSALISASAIQSTHISASTIQSTHISASTIQGTHISASTIQGTHIKAATISGTHISAGTISGTHIAASTISGTHISAGTISGTHIAAGTIQASHISASSITSDKMSVSSLSAINANLGTITAGVIQSNAQVIFDNNGYQFIIGNGFGAQSNLLMYYGPSGSVATRSSGTAVMYVSTQGTLYWGGQAAGNGLAAAASPNNIETTVIGGTGWKYSDSTTVTPIGGKPSYTYAWSRGTPDNGAISATSASSATTTFKINGLAAGGQADQNMKCVITDANSATTTVVVGVTIIGA